MTTVAEATRIRSGNAGLESDANRALDSLPAAMRYKTLTTLEEGRVIDAARLAGSEAVQLACASRKRRVLLASVCMGCTLILLPGAVDNLPGPMPAPLVAPTCWQPHARAHEPPLTLVTITAGLDPRYSACLRANRQAYARLHGYEYCDFSANVAAHRAFGFQKLVALHHLFSERKPGGLAWYLDADALVMNQSIAIDALLAEHTAE